MGPILCGVLTVTVLLLSMLAAAYLNWPCPPLSGPVNSWQRSDAAYFSMRGKQMFYKGFVHTAANSCLGDGLSSQDAHSGKGKLGETVVLLHGFPTSSYDWVKMWPVLVENFDRVIAMDFLGHGLSDKPTGYNYTIFEQADYVTNLLRAIKVEKFHILAHDYGDTVAQELLHRQNNGELAEGMKIKSACLMNGGIFSETYRIRPVQRLMLYPGIGPIISSLSNRYIFKKAFSEIFGPDTQPTPEELYDFWCLSCHNQGYLANPYILDYVNQRSYNNVKWREALSQSKCPVHFIYGPADPIHPPPHFEDFYREMIPKGSLDILDDKIGHYVQWEDSSRVAQLYLQFIRKVIKK